MQDYCHLHCHTQFSLLDGATDIQAMMKKAVSDGQSAVALTDHGNMFGAFKFVKEANKAGIKPIIGCEFYLVEDRHIHSFEKSKGDKDIRYHQLMLAKNSLGYKNLSKLCSLGFTEGLYGKFPRIDKSLIEKYHEGLIATSCCIGAEVPQAILNGNIEEAERKLKWWLNIFGEDYYIELQRHRGMDNIDGRGISQEDVNQVLIGFAKKYNIKTIVTNDSHYLEEEDALPHDILLCVNTGSYLMDEKRFKFPSSDFFFKTKSEMNRIFTDVPFALENTMEIASKVEHIDLTRDMLLPAFPIPKGYANEEDYLYHLTYKGAQKRYGTISPIVDERLKFELGVVNKSGYAGYFLIVEDFTSTARQMGVVVGPGRGSAAGSAVAYCLGITSIDPIKYNLLFERFLNVERVSMPDIDIDFDDEGREKVINYVIEKYGKHRVAQIITYGTMAAKSSLKDVGRVMNIPLFEVEQVTKTFPVNPEATLKGILAPDDIESSLKGKLTNDDIDRAKAFRKLAEQDNPIGNMIATAKKLEGSVRNTGIHACGVIITPDDITDILPVTVAKDSDLLVTQFDNSVVEESGLLKMDFLGLKTLTIIKDAVRFVKEHKGIEIDIENVDLEDSLTYELFTKGETVAIFQYESDGMQKNLKDLKPNRFEDLIAMNALYRPGPIAYIPDFIKRKHGQQQIKYDLKGMESFLSETYGITVYQEQVMLLSQKLADFTKGEADQLRKAMGKKNRTLLDKMLPKFLSGCATNGHDETIAKKIWADWESFASYAFNKSHSTCYAYLAFQTAYLKAHHPVDFMASVLNHNKNNIASLNFFLSETRRMGIKTLGPDINESRLDFSINEQNQIRFGLSALKGVGEGPVEELLKARNDGPFKDIFDLMRRLNLRSFNKKCLDSLVQGGALDSFDIHRARYFAPSGSFPSFIEHALRYGTQHQSLKTGAQASLFGDSADMNITEPNIPECAEWSSKYQLELEKEVTGIYLSAHPLDDFNLEFNHFVKNPVSDIDDTKDKDIIVGGIVTTATVKESQRGTKYVRFTLEDRVDSKEINLYSESFQKFGHFIIPGNVIYLEGSNRKRQNSDQYFFNVKEIRMMDSIGKLFTKSITVRLELDNINDNFVQQFNTLVENNKGEHKLKVRVVDCSDPGLELSLISDQTINASYEFAKAMADMNLLYKIN